MNYKTKEQALNLLRNGLSPVLLGRAGDDLKRPIQKNWQVRHQSESDVLNWPGGHNVGVRLGRQVSGAYLVCFDFDHDAKRLFKTWYQQAQKMIDTSFIVQSGQGYHFYAYVITDEPVHSTKLARCKDGQVRIELRGERAQMVTPGSRHPGGKVYQVHSGSYADIPLIKPDDFTRLCGLAQKENEFEKHPQVRRGPRRGGAGQTAGEYAGLDCLSYARQVIGGEEKQEYNGDIRIAGHGGLIVTGDGRGWFCHSENTGGGLVDLIAWYEGITKPAARAKVARPASRFVLYPGSHDLTIELNEGDFLGDVLDPDRLPNRSLIAANTGVGKTTAVLRLSGRVVLVVPTQALLEQLCKLHSNLTPFYQYQRVIAGDEQYIITTPNSIDQLLPLIDSSLYTLAVDEFHLIAIEAFRATAWNNVVRCLGGDWVRVIGMTGTPFPFVTDNLEIFQSVAVTSPARHQPARLVKWQREENGKRVGCKVATCAELLPDPAGGCFSLIYLQDKKQNLDRLVWHLRQKGYERDQIALINADTRSDRHSPDNDAFLSLTEAEEVPAGVLVVIATSVIREGVNIRQKCQQVHLLTGASSIEAQQLANRFRNDPPGMVYAYIGADEGGETRFNLRSLLEQLLAEAQNQAEALNAYAKTPEEEAFMKYKVRMVRQPRVPLVERVEDELTGSVRWEPSCVGVNHTGFAEFAKCEQYNPPLLKNNTAKYGWQWGTDIELIVRVANPARQSYVEEKEAERYVNLEQLCLDLEPLGECDAREKARQSARQTSLFMRSVTFALGLMDRGLARDWTAAVTLNMHSLDSDRRRRKFTRQLLIQRDREKDHVTQKVYELFDVGGRYTSREMAKRLLWLFDSDDLMRHFVKARYDGDERISPPQAVRILRNYFEMKRCKIRNQAGDRENGYEIIADCPHVKGAEAGSRWETGPVSHFLPIEGEEPKVRHPQQVAPAPLNPLIFPPAVTDPSLRRDYERKKEYATV